MNYPAPLPEHGQPDELYRVLHKTLGVPLFQEQAMRIAIEAAKFTSGGSQRPAPRHGDVPQRRHHRQIRRQVDRQHDRARLRSPEFAKNCFKQIKGFGSYGFPGKPCRELRPAGLYLVMAEALSPRRLLLRPAQFAADGLLRARADRRRCPHQRRRGARDRRVPQFCAEHAGGGRGQVLRGAAGLSPDRWV